MSEYVEPHDNFKAPRAHSRGIDKYEDRSARGAGYRMGVADCPAGALASALLDAVDHFTRLQRIELDNDSHAGPGLYGRKWRWISSGLPKQCTCPSPNLCWQPPETEDEAATA